MNALGPRPSTYGQMSARIAPQLHIPAKPEPPPLRGRILTALKASPATAQGLASLLDVKELTVTQVLGNMLHEGLVTAGPLTDAGRRAQRWRAA